MALPETTFGEGLAAGLGGGALLAIALQYGGRDA
jgi:hypothetical protein